MNRLLALARPAPVSRKLLYRLLSLVIIASMLLQPLTTIAVTTKAPAVSPVALSAPDLRSAVVPPALSDAAVQARPLVIPAAKVRAVEEVSPTSSGALPPYPMNHTLNPAYTYFGDALPTNGDLSIPGYNVGTPPANYDFSAAPYPVGTPPTNYDFATGDFSDWTTSGTTAIQSDATRGPWAELKTSAVITTAAFLVDSATQQLTFELGYLTTNNYSWVDVYVLTGATYSTATRLGELNCYKCGYWITTNLNLAAYQGQNVKIKFLRRFGTVGIDAVRQQVLFPSYIPTGNVERITEATGNLMAQLNGGAAIVTEPLLIANETQLLSLKTKGLTNLVDQYWLYVLSGPNYATSTRLTNYYQTEDEWQTVKINTLPWQGQSIKLRIVHQYGKVAIDEIGLQKVTLPGWQVTEGTAEIVTEPDGQKLMSVKGRVQSDEFVVPPDRQHISLAFKLNGPWCKTIPTLSASVGAVAYRGTTVLAAFTQVATCNGREFKMGIGAHENEPISVELYAPNLEQYYTSFSLGGGEMVLPGWTPDSITDAIETGHDDNGTYITHANGNWDAVQIHSGLISTGILDRSTHVDFKHYSISYALGHDTLDSILRVWWINEQGQSWVVMQDSTEAGTQTGYRTRYFGVADFMGARGRFSVGISGDSKLYSIADNVARQQLNEPFAYKVGYQIDTSTGAFGYQAEDLRSGGTMPLIFTRYYNGHSDQMGKMGYSWSHSYETRLDITQVGNAGVIFGAGREVFFIWNSTAHTFTPADARIHDTLVKNSNGTYSYITKEKLTYQFDSAGVLAAVSDPNNNSATLGYTNGQLTTIDAPGNAALTLGYDGDGRLQSVSDSVGGSVTYGYDSNGDLVTATRTDRGTESYLYDHHRLQQVTDAGGHILFHNTFDSVNRVVQQQDALAEAITLAYNTPAAGVTQVADPKGNVAHYYFDQYQRTTDRVDPVGNVVSYLYDGVGNLAKVIDAAFGEWDFAYDGNGNLLETEDPVGNPLQISYNPQNLPTTVIDGNGNVTWMEYDAKGNVTRIVDPLDHETIFVYDGAGHLQSMTNQLGQTETYVYDAAGNRLSRTNALGQTWSWTYNAANRMTSETDPLGHMTRYIYDLAGRVIAIRNHLDGQKNFLYDPVGHLLMSEDELGRRTYWDYNDVGLVEIKTDPEGKQTHYQYDENRNMTKEIDPNQLVTEYIYDAGNRVKQIIEPGNRVTEYFYDGSGRMVEEKNARGFSTYYGYDDAGRVLTTTMPLGTVYTFAYDGNGNRTQTTDPLNRSTWYTYDELNRLAKVTDPLGYTTRYGYDAAGQQISITNALTQTYTSTYNAAGLLVKTVDPLLRETTYGYDPAGNRTSVTDPLLRTESIAYDVLNRPEYFTNAAGRTTQFVYDAASQLIRIIEPTPSATRQTNFTYDGRGLRKTVVNALNQTTTYIYDNGGRLAQTQDPDNLSTFYGYDPVNGFLKTITDRMGKVTSYAYDLAGNLTALTDPLQRTQTMSYDELNRLKTVAAPNSAPMRYEYYADGQVKELWSPAQRPTYYTYDGRGLLQSVANAYQHTTSYTYDALGRVKKLINGRQFDTYYTYDNGGRLTELRDHLGGTVTYGYDAGDRVTSLTNPNNKTTTFSYNALDNLLTKLDPLQRSYTYTYDDFGRTATVTDARQQQVSYQYDLLDRVQQISHPGGADNYVYDNMGRLDYLTDATGTTDFAYDQEGRVTQVAAPQGAVGYTYNDAGQRSSMTLPNARTVTYGYNGAAQLQTITDWSQRTITMGYDGDGNLAGINRYNGVNSTYGYDNAGRLTTISHDGPGGNLLNFTYGLDENGNRTSLTSNLGAESYTLDPLDRLTNLTAANGLTLTHSYSPNGDRQSTTTISGTVSYQYDDAGQLLADGTTSYTYDANGNVLTAGADSYQWDWANRLAGATVGGQGVNYTYDATGTRVSESSNGTTTPYLWDRLAGLPQLIDDGSQAYLHGAGPVAQIDPAGTRYDLLPDGLNSVRGLADGSGALAGTASFTAFGGWASQSGVSSRFGFTGEYYAAATGMWHLRARDLNPTLGRFLSADSVQPNAPGTQGYNLYAYVANNPTTWVDPSGHTAAFSDLSPNQQKVLAALIVSTPLLFLALPVAIAGVFLYMACVLEGECRAYLNEAWALIDQLGSDGSNDKKWDLDALVDAYQQWPMRPVLERPFRQMYSMATGIVPGLGDLYDLYSAFSGYDPITGESISGWGRGIAMAAAIVPFFSRSQLEAISEAAVAVRYTDERVSGLTPTLQDAIVRSIRESGDEGMLLAFRGRAPGSYIWDGRVPQKPVGAENLWKGFCGLRVCVVPTKGGGKTWGYYVSDLDAAWAVTGEGRRLTDDELYFTDGGIYQSINDIYGVDVIQHGAHLNAVLDGIGGRPVGPEKYDKLFKYVTDPYDQVFIFSVNGFVGSGLLGPTYADAIRGRLSP